MTNNGINIKFEIFRETYIELKFPTPIHRLLRDDYYTANLCTPQKCYSILDKNGYESEALAIFDAMLERGLDGNLELHESLQEDIGYLENEELNARGAEQKPGRFFYDNVEEGLRRWVGRRYFLWYNIPMYQACWFYGRQGRFFLELTNTYRWSLCEPDPEDNFTPYKEFIKNYKPTLILEIPRECLRTWKRQTSRIMHVIEVNEARIRISGLNRWRHRRIRRIKRLRRAWSRS